MNYAVLVVDDEPQNIELADLVLRKEGYRLFHAENGEEAWKVLKQHTIHVIVLDLMMPKLNGFEFLERIKADETYKLIPVLVVTALGEESNRNRALSSGADAYLVKPYDIIDLKMRVKAMLKVAEGFGNTPSEVLNLWFETTKDWMDGYCKSQILSLFLQSVGRIDGALLPMAYRFIYAYGNDEYTLIDNPVVVNALKANRYEVAIEGDDAWSKLLRILNISIIRFKSSLNTIESDPLLKYGLGKYYLSEDLKA